MRYRVDQAASDAAGAAAVGGTDAVLLLTGVIGVVVGVILTWAGWRGRQMWLVVWCGGLVVASVAYIAAILVEAS